MENFKQIKKVENFSELIKLLTHTIFMMEQEDLTQFGFKGRIIEDGTIHYGEGKTQSGVELEDWNIWRPGFEGGELLTFIGDYASRRVGRIRLMRIVPHHCYSWHRDLTPRLHIPLITVKGAFIVVQEESKQLTKGNLWWVDTTKWHTAFNGGTSDRYHLVYEVEE